mmetsp:Transcript_30775/g.69067  ORF Transcript_30775/g.69067 Transcript_30775/m.69067 type:complete len:1016 (-) Transcript_30775:364-3411(-)
MEDKTLVRRFIAPADEWIFKREECVGEAASSKNVISVFRNTGSKQLFGGIARNGTLSRVKNWPTECVDGNGVRIKGGPGAVLTSLLDNHRLIQLAPDALTFEMWVSFNRSAISGGGKMDEIRPLLLFGQTNAIPASALEQACDETPWFDLAFWSNALSLEALAPAPLDAVVDDDACLDARSVAESPTGGVGFLGVSHLVMVVNGTGLNVYLDGELALSSPAFLCPRPLAGPGSSVCTDGSSLGARLRDDQFHGGYHLQLLSAASVLEGSLQALPATLWYLAVYDTALDAEAVSQNMAAKLPNSLPVCFDLSVTMNEDGEKQCGASLKEHPERYQSPLPVDELDIITLRCFDQDNDVSHPNYDPAITASLPPALKLGSLPARGELFQALDGAPVDRIGSELLAAPDGTISLHYRPAFNEYYDGAFDSFEYYATDGVTGLASAQPARVLVYVVACNDPPVAQNVTAVALASSWTKIYLNGSDVDRPDGSGPPFAVAWVTALPKQGGAFLAQKRSATGLIENVTKVPCRVLANDYIFYGYFGDESLILQDTVGTLARDAFRFRVSDAAGANSSEASVTVAVRTALVTLPTSAFAPLESHLASPIKKYTVYEETPGNVSIFAMDRSDKRREVTLRVVRTPRHGDLVDPETGRKLEVGSRLVGVAAWPYSAPLLVTYTGRENYFNSPQRRFDGSALVIESWELADREGGLLVRGGGDGFEVATELAQEPAVRALPAVQGVVIVNVNDPPRLEWEGPSSRTLSTEALTSLALPGFRLVDSDRDVDAVKVQVSCDFGYLTVSSRQALQSVDFSSHDTCYGHDDWTCIGDGTGDRTLRFVGQPSSVSDVLASLEYETTFALVADTIKVDVYDGQRTSAGPTHGGWFQDSERLAGSCLEATDFRSTSRRGPGPFEFECFRASANVTIIAAPPDPQARSKAPGSSGPSSSPQPPFSPPFSLAWPCAFSAHIGLGGGLKPCLPIGKATKTTKATSIRVTKTQMWTCFQISRKAHVCQPADCGHGSP